jgi:hypothetical protein
MTEVSACVVSLAKKIECGAMEGAKGGALNRCKHPCKNIKNVKNRLIQLWEHVEKR